MLTPGPHRSGQRGISLIEVMVALIIFSVGLLALAGLQSSSLIENQVSYLRSQAVMLAGDMADRMRANPQAVENGDYNNATAVAGGSPVGACFTAAGCTPANMADHDRAVWGDALDTVLPRGQGVVCVDSTPQDGTAAAPACDGGTVGGMSMQVIKVFWERNGEQRFTTQVRLNR